MKDFKLKIPDNLHAKIKVLAKDDHRSMHSLILSLMDSHCRAVDLFKRGVEVSIPTGQFGQLTKEPTTATGVLIKYGSEMTRKPTKVLPGGVVTIEELKKPKKKPKCPHADDLVDICANCIKKR